MYKIVNCVIFDEISRLIRVVVINEVLFIVFNIMIL